MGSMVEAIDGRPVLVRTGGAELERLAETLRRLAGSGVPSVLRCDAADDGVRLVTTWSPALLQPASPADLASIAAVVARVHDLGVVHGPFEAADLRTGPVVEGWDDPPDGWTAADDVASFGAFVERAGLGALAGRARAEDASVRPGMAALAAALTPASARTLAPVRAQAGRPRDRRPLPWWLLVAPAAAVAVIAVVSLLRHDDVVAATPQLRTTTTIERATTTTSTTVAVHDDVTVDGNLVVRDGERWHVGRPGDVVAVGDWDGDGIRSPAVLRPATAQVWAFDSWPVDGEPTLGRAVATVPGAVDLRARPQGGRDVLEVVDAYGASTVVG